MCHFQASMTLDLKVGLISIQLGTHFHATNASDLVILPTSTKSDKETSHFPFDSRPTASTVAPHQSQSLLAVENASSSLMDHRCIPMRHLRSRIKWPRGSRVTRRRRRRRRSGTWRSGRGRRGKWNTSFTAKVDSAADQGPNSIEKKHHENHHENHD